MRHTPFARRLIVAGALALSVAAAPAARAQGPTRTELYAEPLKEGAAASPRATAPAPVRYTGATFGLALQGGPTLMTDDTLSSRVGFVAGVAGRMTGPFQLSDGELAYHASRSSPSGRAGEVAVTRHALSFTAGVHPLFLVVLGNRRLHYVLNSLHFDIGASYNVTTLGFGAQSLTRGDLGWQWGGGLDIPLQDPNRGVSWWLGLRYRQARVNTDLAPERIVGIGQHQLLVSLEHRWNWK